MLSPQHTFCIYVEITQNCTFGRRWKIWRRLQEMSNSIYLHKTTKIVY